MFSVLHAEEVAQSSKPVMALMQFAPFILIFIIFYFLLIRPQRKKQKEHQNLIAALKVGDKVLLTSGITGSVSKLKDDNYIMVKISENVEVEVLRAYVATLITK